KNVESKFQDCTTLFQAHSRAMLHEVLVACLGHPGDIIRDESLVNPSKCSQDGEPGTYRVPEWISFIAPTEREAINRVVGLGSIYRRLREFSQPDYQVFCEGIATDRGVGGQKTPELYVRALKLGVEELLDEYAGRVAGVERDVMDDPTLTISRINAGLREFMGVLPAVGEFCEALAEPRAFGTTVLEMLHARSQYGSPDVRQRLDRLLWHCSQVLLNQIMAWVIHGMLVDPFHEFFIQH
ncbi:unnamed protein product, partial [Discosporangium mesarthrocarpum]